MFMFEAFLKFGPKDSTRFLEVRKSTNTKFPISIYIMLNNVFYNDSDKFKKYKKERKK